MEQLLQYLNSLKLTDKRFDNLTFSNGHRGHMTNLSNGIVFLKIKRKREHCEELSEFTIAYSWLPLTSNFYQFSDPITGKVVIMLRRLDLTTDTAVKESVTAALKLHS